MLLDDACIYVRIDEPPPAPDLRSRASEMINAGVDAIEVRTGDVELAREVSAACSEEDALCIIADGDTGVATGAGADGVCLPDGSSSVGGARAGLPARGLVGIETSSLSDAMLVLELEPDFVLHQAGTSCHADFMGLRGIAATTLFAGGDVSVADAAEMVEKGVYRFCLDYGKLSEQGDVIDQLVQYSRCLGRSI